MNNNIIAKLRRGLIVSCQAEPEKGSQLFLPKDIARLAKEVLLAGACAVRICGIENIRVARVLNPNAVIIGITKDAYPDGKIIITESLEAIRDIVRAGANIVGLDMTKRVRPSGVSSTDLLQQAKKEFSETLFMADLADAEETKTAITSGADIIATTLSGYTQDTQHKLKPHRWYEYWPDMELVKNLTQQFPNVPIVAEGRWRDPEQCYQAINECGAWAVCVGSQITRPREMVRWHLNAIAHGDYSAPYK